MNRNCLDFKLYLITGRNLLAANCQLVTAVEQALRGGVRAIQLREKNLSTRELLRLAHMMRELTKKYNAKLFINDGFDIALAVEADGVHLTQTSIPADAVKKAVKKDLLIGVSTHSIKEAREAERAGADFITVGPIYRTPSKLRYGSPLGVSRLKKVTSEMRIPIFAIGGVKGSRIKDLRKAGAYGVAMISEIFGAPDIQRKAREIVETVEGM